MNETGNVGAPRWVALLNLGNRSAPTSGFGRQPGLTTLPSPLRGVPGHLTGAAKAILLHGTRLAIHILQDDMTMEMG